MRRIKIDPKLTTSKAVIESKLSLDSLIPIWERQSSLTLCRLFKDEEEMAWGWAKLNFEERECPPARSE